MNHKRIKATQLGRNIGIAAAQNIGIKAAREADATHVILFDQDSTPKSSLVQELLEVERQAASQGIRVAALGPQIVDEKTNELRQFYQGSTNPEKRLGQSRRGWKVCDFLIASGCLIPVSAVELVGGMDEELFIDCVDIEWGYRAKSQGLFCVGVSGTYMNHPIGNDSKKILGQSFNFQPPERYYFFFRNSCALLKRPYVSIRWKLRTVWRATIYAVILLTGPYGNRVNYQMILKGLKDGLRGMLGPGPAAREGIR